MAFDNSTIKPKRQDKPHIVFRDGWWRISEYETKKHYQFVFRFRYAYQFVSKLNDHLIMKRNQSC